MKSLITESIKPLYKFITSKNQREFVKLLDRWGGVERYSRRDILFLSYRFDVPDCLSFVWQFKDIFVDEIYRFEAGNPSPVIYDCGANIGTSCLYFKLIYPSAKIKAFEADPLIAEVLKSNLSRNGITDIDVIGKAAWVSSTGVEFSSVGADTGSVYGSEKLVKIESIRLRELIEKEAVIDMLKLDVEGAETDIIQDCRDVLKGVKNLFVEYHSWTHLPQRLDETLRVLKESGFRYHMQPVAERKRPFVNKGLDLSMDLQMNIFAYRR